MPRTSADGGEASEQSALSNAQYREIHLCPYSQIYPFAGSLHTPVWTDPGAQSRDKLLLASLRQAALGNNILHL